jgi:hypothetical protein
MDEALRRGASRVELARVAVAVARAVLPLVHKLKIETTAVVVTAEVWTATPTVENAAAVARANCELNARREGDLVSPEIATSEDWARTAVDAAAMACCAPYGAEMLALLAVECACEAAGGDADLAPLVTAALL